MGRSGLLPHPAQVPSRRRRKFPWEEEGVPARTYDDEEEWQEEAFADDDAPPAYQDEDELAEDASHYAALDSNDPALASEEDADYPDEVSDPSAEQEWAEDPDQDDNAQERGLVPYHSGQTGSFTRQGGALVSYGEASYTLEPGSLPPIFIAGERKTDKIGALGHTPIAPRAHRPRPFFFHTLTLAIMMVSLIISALTVGALSGGLLGLNNFSSMVGAAAPPPPPVKFHWYTVRFTDTVEGIAKIFHVKSGGILELNGLVDGEQIYTGMNLKVPADPAYGANFHNLMHIPYAPAFTPPGPYGSYLAVPGFNSFAVQDYAGDPYGDSFGQCTWWAAHKRPDENLTGIGNAWTWADGARARGYTVTSWPVPNATVVFQPGAEGALGAGHVAHVEQLLPGGWILVSEMNTGWNGGGWGRVDYRYITPGPGVMFIH